MLTTPGLLLTGLAVAALTAPSGRAWSQTPGGARPNIIVLVADDLGWRDVGVYGNQTVRTPNIDRLARSGLRVERAFVTTPQCSPSRISTLTGKYAHATGTEDLHTPLPDSERILPSHLQAQGYFTGMMAKTHLGPNGERQFQWYSPDLSPALATFLDSADTRPFFLWVGFHDPHRPYERAAVPHSPAGVTLPPRAEVHVTAPTTLHHHVPSRHFVAAV